MKYVYIIPFFLVTSFAFAQSTIKKDIDDKYLDKLLINSDSTLATEFQRFAVNLFKKGTSLNDSIFNETTRDRVIGICLIYKEKDNVKQELEITLNTLSYKDLRTKDFHKSIYYGKGREGFANFFVDHDTDEQLSMINEAVNFYLKHDSIPRNHPAYQFTRTYENDDEYFEKFFKTDKYSTLIIGSTYAYLRQNGNYIIQIEGGPDKALNKDTEELYVTDYFIDDWYSISVFIIDDSNNKAYNRAFND
ncbi:hypothetical protein [Psychroserpens damuponensis]|uniref:hypothetical protein n=1 Tax=Psychroserpens damuponensis TaxID=943936 RepID=UPI00058C7170|nr:hypothetical protein [Psychroserpens damuponensis]